MQRNADKLSTPGANFVLKSIAAGVRVDGRRNLEPRPLSIAFGADGANGSVQVRLGDTKVLATATAELIEPYPDRPTEGVLQFFAELSPMASPAFEPGRPSEAAIELMKLLERALRKSQAIDVESMCVVSGKHVWSVRVDVTVLDHRGNLTDASTLAALAALKHLRLPAVSVAGAGEEASVTILPADQAERQPLVFHHTPVAVSLAFYDEPDAGGGRSSAAAATGGSGKVLYVVDPSDREELVMSGCMSVVLNQHQELCAVHKPGGVPVDALQLVECVQHASTIAPTLLLMLEHVLDAHRQKLADAAETLRRTGRVAAKALAAGAGPLLTPAAALGPTSATSSLPAAAATAAAAGASASVGSSDRGSNGGSRNDASSAAEAPRPAAAPSAKPTAAAAAAAKAGSKRAAHFDSDEEEETVVSSAFGTTGAAAAAAAPPRQASNGGGAKREEAAAKKAKGKGGKR